MENIGNNEILENNWDNDSTQSINEQRGSFLLVLCILSWVWIAYALFSGLISILNGDAALEEVLGKIDVSEVMEQSSGNPLADSMLTGMAEMMGNLIEHFYHIQYANFVALMIGALSVFLMFSLKKIGFTLYAIYTFAIPGITLYFLGTSMLVWLSVGLSGFLGVVFLIMYGVNLKRMTK